MAHPCKVLPILRRLIFLTGWAASRPERVQEPKSEVATAPIHEPTQVEQSMPAPFANTRSFWIVICQYVNMSTCHLHPTKSFNVLGFSRMGQQYETGHLGSCWKGSHAAVTGRPMLQALTFVLWDPSLNFCFTIQMIWYMAFELKECIAKSSFSSGHLPHVVVLIGFRNHWGARPHSAFTFLVARFGGRKGRLFQNIFPRHPPMSAKWAFKCAKLAPAKKKLRIPNDSQKWKDLFFTQKPIHSRNNMETSGSSVEYYSQRWTCSSGPVLDTRSTEIHTNELSFETCVQMSTVPRMKL